MEPRLAWREGIRRKSREEQGDQIVAESNESQFSHLSSGNKNVSQEVFYKMTCEYIPRL